MKPIDPLIKDGTMQPAKGQSTENTIYIYTVKMNSDCHYVVVISVAKYSDCHYVLPQISLPRSDSHYSIFTVYNIILNMYID